MHLELVQSLVVGREVHQLVSDRECRVLGKVQRVLHLLLSLSVPLHIVDLPNAVLEDIITTPLILGTSFVGDFQGPLALGLLQLI
jgi:hypothetical protein